MPRSGSSMVGDKQQKTKQNSIELQAKVGAVAKADQQKNCSKGGQPSMEDNLKILKME